MFCKLNSQFPCLPRRVEASKKKAWLDCAIAKLHCLNYSYIHGAFTHRHVQTDVYGSYFRQHAAAAAYTFILEHIYSYYTHAHMEYSNIIYFFPLSLSSLLFFCSHLDKQLVGSLLVSGWLTPSSSLNLHWFIHIHITV